MRRFVSVLLVLFLVAGLALAGCSSSGGNAQPEEPKEGEPQPEPQPEPAKSVELLMATGGTGGTYYPLGGSIASVWSQNIDGVNVTVQPSGASVENMRLLASGQAHLVMAMNNVADNAWNDRGDFESNPVSKEWGAVGVIYPDTYQGIALKDSGVTSITDLKGKKVAVGPPGSGTEVTSRLIMQMYGLGDEKDPYRDIQEEFATFADATDKMKDGHLDAAFSVLGVPAAAIEEVTTARDIVLLGIDKDKIDQYREDYPTTIALKIPAGTYKGQTEDVWTLANPAVLYARSELDEDVVYQLTKIMYEKTADIAKGHAMGKAISLERALDGVTTPLHPGAEKYYKEKGML